MVLPRKASDPNATPHRRQDPLHNPRFQEAKHYCLRDKAQNEGKQSNRTVTRALIEALRPLPRTDIFVFLPVVIPSISAANAAGWGNSTAYSIL